jgi:hypothetical protein
MNDEWVIKPVDEKIVPAERGWMVVRPSYDGKNSMAAELYREPVIAWLVQIFRRPKGETFVDVIPITAGGSVESEDYALQCADLPRFLTIHEKFNDEGALLAHFNKNRRRRHCGQLEVADSV